MAQQRARTRALLAVAVAIAAVLVGAVPAASDLPSRSPALSAGERLILPLSAFVALDPPFNVTEQITDRAGVLGGKIGSLQQKLDALDAQHGLQLFVVYVDSFDGASGEAWAQRTYAASGMGGDDVLLAVAVQDRRYATWTTDESGVTAEQDLAVRSRYIEPALSRSDWAGAVSAAADGYGRAAAGELAPPDTSAPRLTFGGFPWWLLILVAGVAVFALSWRRRRRARSGSHVPGGPGPEGAGPSIEELRKQAAGALVKVDDAVRSSAEELVFAEAQFGVQATQRFRKALEVAQEKAREAFRLQKQLDDDEAADSLDDASRRARLEQIIALASSADESLEAQEAKFVRLRDLQSTVPHFLTELRGRLDEVRRRLPVAEQELAGLAAHHPASALQTVAGNVEQARSLLTSAAGFIDTGEAHLRDDDNRAAAVAAARAAEEAIGQADALLSSVANARQELADAPEHIDQALASLSADIADAQRLRADDPLSRTALAAAHEAITQQARHGGDPLAALRALTRAEHDLDNALARYRAEEERTTRHRQVLDRRMAQVRARLASIDETISSRRGAIGPQARTHIAEATRLYNDATEVVEADPARAGALLERAESQGERALQAAQEDIDSWSWQSGTFTGYRGIDPTSLVLGGILAGGLGGHGGGWGGSLSGFGGGGRF